MRIAIIAHNLRVAGGLSVGRNSIAALSRVADQHDYLLTLPVGVGYESIELPTRAETRYFHRRSGPRGVLAQLWYDFLALEREVNRWKPDRIWGLGNFGLRHPACPQAVVCQDAHFTYDPNTQPKKLWDNGPDMKLAAWRMKRTVAPSRLVFCQTQTMVERFRALYGFSGKMAVMPNAVSRYGLAGSPARPAIFDRLGGKFVLLALTRYYMHKNLEVLAEMFHRHAAKLGDVVVLLTFDPTQGYGADKFVAKIQHPAIRDFFVNVGPVPQPELFGYFKHAAALIQPTVLESFSTTYLEAMQFGAPILTSDMDFAREVCGDAALYFDPWNADAVFQAIERFRAEPALGPALVERGRIRMERFFRSWDEIVREAVEHIEAM